MKHQPSFGYYLGRLLLIWLACLIINAFIVGLSSSYFHIATQELHGVSIPISTTRMYVNAVYFAFVYLVLFGYWIAYFIPAATMHILAVYRRTQLTPWRFIPISWLVWTLMGIASDFLLGDALKQGWWKWPTNQSWITAPEFGLIGLVYGSLYWYWYVKPFQEISSA